MSTIDFTEAFGQSMPAKKVNTSMFSNASAFLLLSLLLLSL